MAPEQGTDLQFAIFCITNPIRIKKRPFDAHAQQSNAIDKKYSHREHPKSLALSQSGRIALSDLPWSGLNSAKCGRNRAKAQTSPSSCHINAYFTLTPQPGSRMGKYWMNLEG